MTDAELDRLDGLGRYGIKHGEFKILIAAAREANRARDVLAELLLPFMEGEPTLAMVADAVAEKIVHLRGLHSDAVGTIDRIHSQLPEGMENCTIQFISCPKGHGRLTAANWIDHGCGTCERDRLKVRVAELEAALEIEQVILKGGE